MEGTLYSAAIRSFGRCHVYYQVCFKYFGAVTISWKICLLFGRYTLRLITYHTVQDAT